MEEQTRLAVVAVIIENPDSAEKVNAVLHEFREFIAARLGLPYEKKQLSVISIIVDAPPNVVNSLNGRLGMIGGVSAKALFSSK